MTALITDDKLSIAKYEERARLKGYGPLAPCFSTSSNRAQREFCRRCCLVALGLSLLITGSTGEWHRLDGGELSQCRMAKSDSACPNRISVFIPNDLTACPQVLIVSYGPHTHPAPPPSKTPQVYLDILSSLLRDLDWQLADATARRVMRSSAFVRRLKELLQWQNLSRKPVLGDLHPSLRNLDHVNHIIKRVRGLYYPKGTGWEGTHPTATMLALKGLVSSWVPALEEIFRRESAQNLPSEQRYIRAMEHFKDQGDRTGRFIICMLAPQAELLQQSKRLNGDTSFKRVPGWYEFSFEEWNITEQACEYMIPFIHRGLMDSYNSTCALPGIH